MKIVALVAVTAILSLSSCSKSKSCTAYDANDNVLQSIEGEDACAAAIDTSAGEYCTCAEALDS